MMTTRAPTVEVANGPSAATDLSLYNMISVMHCLSISATASSKVWNSDTQAGLFRLPPELRNRIYEMIVPRNNLLGCCSRLDRVNMGSLQICHAIRTEAISIFYGCNTFCIDMRSERSRGAAWKWLDGLCPTAIAALRHLRLTAWVRCDCSEGGATRFFNMHNLSKRSGLLLTATIQRGGPKQKYEITVERCARCGSKSTDRAATEAAFTKHMQTLKLNDEKTAVDRAVMTKLLSLLQSTSLERAEGDHASWCNMQFLNVRKRGWQWGGEQKPSFMEAYEKQKLLNEAHCTLHSGT